METGLVASEDLDGSTSSDYTRSTTSGALNDDGSVEILFELVGAYQLSLEEHDDNDIKEDDLQPYCIVKSGDRIVHRTDPAKEKGINPVWTISSNSLFLLVQPPWELARQELQFSIWAKVNRPLSVGTVQTYCLGKVKIELGTFLLQHNMEERIELPLRGQFEDCDTPSRGSVAIRFRLASAKDKRFIQLIKNRFHLLRKTSDPDLNQIFHTCSENIANEQLDIRQGHTKRKMATLVTEADETQVAGEQFAKAFSNVFERRTSRKGNAGEQSYRVKPNPDPLREKATRYMTNHEICSETRLPSREWVEVGSGTLGKLYLEVLACHDLPNVDVGEAVGNLSDCFVSVVFEDAAAQTPVIDDELSPHWLPWTQRAFCFGIMHPASVVYLAVFDYDFGIGRHDPLGRVAVNINNLERDMVYTLKYNLHPSATVTNRTVVGAITIRLRIEYENESKAILAALKPRPQFHINTRKEKSFRVIRYTCFGEHDNEEKFDLEVTRSYINEIFEYKRDLGYCIGDTLKSLMFWRGQVRFFDRISLPVHSLLFFCATTTLVERPHLTPPFLILSVAWILIAKQTQRSQNPSPWHRGKSFWYFLQVLRRGEHMNYSLKRIYPYEGHKEKMEHDDMWAKRIEADERLAATQYELEQSLITIGDDTIQTKVAGSVIPLDLLERLGRWQGIIGRYCRYFRCIKMVVTGEESIMSFWIAASFLVAGSVSILLPWSFLLKWSGRTLVWGFFGPHMKLVDWTLSSSPEDKSPSIKKAMENFQKLSKTARIRREEALKLRDMKCMSFGQYITLVPAFNLARHHDLPLPESYARICRAGTTKTLDCKSPWIPGQQLVGVMIPRPVNNELKRNFTDEEEQRVKDAEERFASLQTMVKVLQQERLLTCELLSSNLDEGMPSDLGFELVVKYDDDENDNGSDPNYYGPYDALMKGGAAVVDHPSISVSGGSIVVLEDTPDSRERKKGVDFGRLPPVKEMDESGDMGIEVVDLGQFAIDAEVLDQSYEKGASDELDELDGPGQFLIETDKSDVDDQSMDESSECAKTHKSQSITETFSDETCKTSDATCASSHTLYVAELDKEVADGTKECFDDNASCATAETESTAESRNVFCTIVEDQLCVEPSFGDSFDRFCTMVEDKICIPLNICYC